MKLIVCSCCGLEKKHHAKNMCKPCYCKSSHYKVLRKDMDKKYQSKNKHKIYEVRKIRRTSIEYKESDDYAKSLITQTYGLSRETITRNPYLLKIKKATLKTKRIILKIKKDE
jgi:hypothetical protein